MRPTLYTVRAPGLGELSVMAKPRGGDWLADEMAGLAGLGVNVLVCLLTDSEIAELDLLAEGSAAQAAGLTFLRLPISDRGLPERGALNSLVTALVDARRRGEHVVTHCRFGIGRSSLVAAAVLVAEGVPADIAWQSIGNARGRRVPDTEDQRAFVASIALSGDLH